MTRTQYLYGVPPSYFKGMTTEEGSTRKIELAKKQLGVVFDLPLSDRSNTKINKLVEAIKHHTYLLKEDDEYIEEEEDTDG